MKFKPTKEEILKFSMDVEELVLSTDHDYIDAVLEICLKYNIDIDIVSALISPSLKAKIEHNAVQRNLLTGKGAELPI